MDREPPRRVERRRKVSGVSDKPQTDRFGPLLALGYINEDTNAKVLTGLSLGITALSSAILIFANGQQQKVAAVETALGIPTSADPGKMPAAYTPPPAPPSGDNGIGA